MRGIRAIPTGVVLLLSGSTLPAQDAREIPLWPNGAPGSQGKTAAEKVRIAPSGDHVVSSVHRPSLTLYLPPKARSPGAAIVIAPGGGHRELWIDHEGHNVARWLRDRGIAAFVLKYRLARDEGSTYSVEGESLADIQRAIRLVRHGAREWGIDTSRVGVMGFSAGGELAALSAMHFEAKAQPADSVDARSSRPAFQALVYPGSSTRFVASKASPPLFIAAGYNDRPDISRGMAELYLKYKDAGIPAELHLYSSVGHGFGMRAGARGASAGWPSRLTEWLVDIHMLEGSP
ncbi:MAG: alpha/beta hydrolase [Gemmatimonadaceae bacterium]